MSTDGKIERKGVWLRFCRRLGAMVEGREREAAILDAFQVGAVAWWLVVHDVCHRLGLGRKGVRGRKGREHGRLTSGVSDTVRGRRE